MSAAQTVGDRRASVVPLSAHPGPALRAVEPSPSSALLHGARLLVLGSDPARTDVLAGELRRAGALVAVVGPQGSGMEWVWGMDAEVALVDAEHASSGEAAHTLRLLRDDIRLRWARIVRLRWERVCPTPGGPIDVPRLAAAILPRLSPLRAFRQRVQQMPCVELAVEEVGPAQWLRSLAEVDGVVRATVQAHEACAEVELAWGLVVRASWEQPRDGVELSGSRALAAFLTLRRGWVRVERCDRPRDANLMLPVDEALALADAELEEVRSEVPTTPPPPPDPGSQVSEPAPAPPPPPELDDDTTVRRAVPVPRRSGVWREPGTPSEGTAPARPEATGPAGPDETGPRLRVLPPPPPESSPPAAEPPAPGPGPVSPAEAGPSSLPTLVVRCRRSATKLVVAAVVIAGLGATSALGWWVVSSSPTLRTAPGPLAPPAPMASPGPASPSDGSGSSPSPSSASGSSPSTSVAAEPGLADAQDAPAAIARPAEESEPAAEAPPADGGPERIRDYRAAREQSDVYVERAERLRADGELALAEEAYRAGWIVAPHNPHAAAGLAELHLERGEAAEAREWVRRAIRLRPRRRAYRALEEDIRGALTAPGRGGSRAGSERDRAASRRPR